MKTRLLIALSASVLVGVLVFPGVVSGHTRSTSGVTVAFRMVEWDTLPTATTKARPGKVTFVVRNAGKLKHEFVVIQTSKPSGNLAPAGAVKAPERGAVGEIEGIAPGQAKRLTLTLRKGHYALICNLRGHYSNGQFVDFYVR